MAVRCAVTLRKTAVTTGRTPDLIHATLCTIAGATSSLQTCQSTELNPIYEELSIHYLAGWEIKTQEPLKRRFLDCGLPRRIPRQAESKIA